MELSISTPVTGITRGADVMAMAEKVGRMPEELQNGVGDFIDFVWGKHVRKRRRKS